MLQGSLDTFELAEVLAMLARKGQTGRLRLHSGPAVVDLYLDAGTVAHAEITDQGSAPRVATSMAALEEACFQILRWDHGVFEFQERPLPAAARRLDAGVEEVMAGARRRLDAWERVKSVIPSMSAQPRLRPELEAAQVTLDRDAWKVLAAIDGRRTVQALARTVGSSTYELCQLLTNLVHQGLVEISSRPTVTIAPPSGAKVRQTIRPDAVESEETVAEA